MKPLLRSLLALVVAVAFSGCLQVESLVSVKPDGSGTVTQTVVMSKATIEQIQQMMGGLVKGLGDALGGGNAKPPEQKPFELLDESKLKENAVKMGEGVTLVSAKKMSTATGEGYVATYAFKDINHLKLDQNPGSSMPEVKGEGVESKTVAEQVTFQFTKGKTAHLVIKNPESKLTADKKKDKKPEPDAPGGDEMAMAMMQQMFKDMRVNVAVEVDGKIVKTDAEHVTGSRATLMEMDFNKLIANPEKFKALSKAQPKTLEETKALVKGVDGIRVETKPKVMIDFQ